MADRKKIKDIAKRWKKIEADGASRIGSIMAEIKDAKSGLLDEAEGAGIKKRAFRAAMKKQKLLDKAKEIGFEEDEDLDAQFDEVQLTLGLIPGDEDGESPKTTRAKLKEQNDAVDAGLRGQAAGTA